MSTRQEIMRHTAALASIIVVAAVLAACSGAGPTTPAKGTDTTGTSKAEFPILVTSQSDAAFSGATDGTNFLIETATADPNPQAPSVANDALQLISPTGAFIGSAIPIASNNRRDLGFVAFDGTNYLAEYEKSGSGGIGEDIYAQLVSRSGTLVGSPIAVTTTHDAFLTFPVAFGAGTYLLTYGRALPVPNDSILQTFARPVSPAGTLGPEVQINAAGVYSDVAFGAGTFMVAYFRGGQNQHQVKIRTVSAAGVAGAETALGPSGVTNGGQIIASNGTNFLVAYGNTIPGDSLRESSSLTVQLVSPSGATVGSPTTITFAAGVGEPLKILASGSNYLVTWGEGPAKGQTTKGQWFTGNGTASGGPFTIVAPNSQSTSALAYLQPGASANRFLALVQRYGTGASPTNDMYGLFLTLSP